MIVGACTVELHLPGLTSLKEKRSVLKSLLARLHREFNVAAAEVALHDVWQSSTVGLTTVSTSAAHAQNLLDNVVNWIERNRPDLEVIDHYVEVLTFSASD
jgi:uncharacterized protein YlxP (DUF503 family)